MIEIPSPNFISSPESEMPEHDQPHPFEYLTPLFYPCVVEQRTPLNYDPYFTAANPLQPDAVGFVHEVQPLPPFQYLEISSTAATECTPQFCMHPDLYRVSKNSVQTTARPIKIPRVVKRTDNKTLERRARNAESVRRSRQRTKNRISELERLVSHLQRENATLKHA